MSGPTSTAGGIPAYLHDLTAVAVARIRGDGVLAEANRGFWSLTGHAQSPATPLTAAELRLHPAVDQLSLGPGVPDGALLYQGALSFQGPAGRAAPPGRIYRWGDGWLVVAEPGLETLECLRLSARRLQHEVAETHEQIRHEAEHRDGAGAGLAPRLNPVERGVAALDQVLQNELAALEQLTQGTPCTVTAQLYGVGLLRENAPDSFRQMVARYGEVLEWALEQRAYRVGHGLTEALRSLAERVGFLGGGPRDVVEVHTAALKDKCRQAAPARTEAYVEESRLLVLEFMGHLVAFYRQYAVLTNRAPPARTGPAQGGTS